MKTVADRLRWLMEHRGLSARGLSLAAKLSPNAVQKVLERGGSANGETLNAIARATKVSLAWLVSGRGSPDDANDAQHETDDIEAELRRSARVMLGDLPDWLEILAIAQQRAKDLNREIPPWVWEAIAASSATLTGKLTGPALYDLAVVFHQHGLGKPVETGAAPTTKGDTKG